MTELTFPQHGDLPDAAFWAFLAGTPPISCIVSGLGLTADYTTPDVEVDSGKAVISRGAMDTAHPNIDPPESLEDSVAVVQVDTQTIGLDTGAMNHLFLQANVASDDSPQVVANTTGNPPSEASVKIGEVDTSNDTASERWHLVENDGTLSYPDAAAATTALSSLPTGVTVIDRTNGVRMADGTISADTLEAGGFNFIGEFQTLSDFDAAAESGDRGYITDAQQFARQP